jgi:hypothetical protein
MVNPAQAFSLMQRGLDLLQSNMHEEKYIESEIVRLMELEGDKLTGARKQVSVSNERVKEVMDSFFHRMIVYRGFKKCKCPSCFKMIYPILIRFDVDCLTYLEKHHNLH